ncbi:hypothetical protein MUB24_20845 [Lederbergia sp. NSJ-179]|uniref:hypothetical protein n=1 Tax=Lederbergia sp. NSJ-179 TaxID=2931402 RepID=UPI001FD3DF27|nr:hypothetical protein [Lederbergia sp. NSJ-179]MCJ7843278.1 hypothetical protein [Lederbergia sp. NSJ-179]
MLLKNYVAALIQIMIWSAFHLAQWLSGKDHLIPKIIIFAVFFYLAYLVAKKIVGSNKATLFITFFSLCTYVSLQMTLQLIFQ